MRPTCTSPDDPRVRSRSGLSHFSWIFFYLSKARNGDETMLAGGEVASSVPPTDRREEGAAETASQGEGMTVHRVMNAKMKLIFDSSGFHGRPRRPAIRHQRAGSCSSSRRCRCSSCCGCPLCLPPDVQSSSDWEASGGAEQPSSCPQPSRVRRKQGPPAPFLTVLVRCRRPPRPPGGRPHQPAARGCRC